MSPREFYTRVAGFGFRKCPRRQTNESAPQALDFTCEGGDESDEAETNLPEAVLTAQNA
jgi:hypothetical protein